jgi:hypothetical protein
MTTDDTVDRRRLLDLVDWAWRSGWMYRQRSEILGPVRMTEADVAEFFAALDRIHGADEGDDEL